MIRDAEKQEKEWYRNWFNAPYYHLLYEERNEEEAAAFIDRFLLHLQPPAGSQMLDIACGKGRHSIHLANKGFSVTGIDISPKSIVEAQKSGHDQLEFLIHDMRLPFRVNYYDFAFNFFTSFGYFDTEREHVNAIRNMALAIKRGGTLVMDYLNSKHVSRHLEPTSKIEKGNIHFSITRWVDEKYFYKKIGIEDADKGRNFTFMEKVANFRHSDFERMFTLAGFKIHEIFGDYRLQEYDENDSPRMIMIAKKKEK
jgi:SAM-dependent methyltransferase